MNKFIFKNLSFFSFAFIPLIYFWNPNWLGFLRVQPYWPLFWLLPWCMIYGSYNGCIVALFLGLTLDSISPDASFTQIPGLIICGLWFGRLKTSSNVLVEHFRHGLICAIGSFLCGLLYFSQILLKNIPNNNLFLYFPSIQNIFAQVFITGLLAPLFCSWLLILFKRANQKNFINFLKK